MLMGVLNVTPDSFYDGGRHDAPAEAQRHAMRMRNDGADIIDIGGESSRPGARQVSTAEELRRTVPVVGAIRACDPSVIISIDTTKAEVAQQALEAGANWINDISAGRFDKRMAPLAAAANCPVVLMHSRATPRDMQREPFYENVVEEVRGELFERVNVFMKAGVRKSRILLDPGIGFAKRIEDNLVLLRNLHDLVKTGFPVLVGTSRKSFIGNITGNPVGRRLWGTLGSVAAAYSRGATFFRVHDVAATRDMLNTIAAIEHGTAVTEQ